MSERMTEVELQKIKNYAEATTDVYIKYNAGEYIENIREDIPVLLDEIVELKRELFECKNTFRDIDALVDLHRLIEVQDVDDLVNSIVGLISDLEQKVGEIT